MKHFIETNPKILGGTLVVIGTRIPVARILFLLKEGYPVEVIQQDYPYVEIETLKGAIDEAIEIVNNQKNASLA